MEWIDRIKHPGTENIPKDGQLCWIKDSEGFVYIAIFALSQGGGSYVGSFIARVQVKNNTAINVPIGFSVWRGQKDEIQYWQPVEIPAL